MKLTVAARGWIVCRLHIRDDRRRAVHDGRVGDDNVGAALAIIGIDISCRDRVARGDEEDARAARRAHRDRAAEDRGRRSGLGQDDGLAGRVGGGGDRHGDGLHDIIIRVQIAIDHLDRRGGLTGVLAAIKTDDSLGRAIDQLRRSNEGEGLRPLGHVEAVHLDAPCAGGRILDEYLLNVVDVIGLGSHRRSTGIGHAAQRPRIGLHVGGAVHAQVQVVDQRGTHVRSSGHVIPRQRYLHLSVAGADDDEHHHDAALRELTFHPVAGAHEVDGRLDANGAVAGLIVGTGIEKIHGGMRQEGLQAGIAEVRPCWVVGAKVLQHQRAQSANGGRGHRCAAQGLVAAACRSRSCTT